MVSGASYRRCAGFHADRRSPAGYARARGAGRNRDERPDAEYHEQDEDDELRGHERRLARGRRQRPERLELLEDLYDEDDDKFQVEREQGATDVPPAPGPAHVAPVEPDQRDCQHDQRDDPEHVGGPTFCEG